MSERQRGLNFIFINQLVPLVKSLILVLTLNLNLNLTLTLNLTLILNLTLTLNLTFTLTLNRFKERAGKIMKSTYIYSSYPLAFPQSCYSNMVGKNPGIIIQKHFYPVNTFFFNIKFSIRIF